MINLIYSYLNIFEDIGDPVLGGALHGVQELRLRPDRHLQCPRHEGGGGVEAGAGELAEQGAVLEVERHAALLHPVDGAEQDRDDDEDCDDGEDAKEDDG